ncbi:WD40-repeat-containing domain protein [Cerioporus squamosus]|nr:WD40-repeat-containing domain protein [Cerioporus squamosus]
MFREYSEKVQLQGGHIGYVTAIAFSPQASLLATAALDRKVCIWETSSHKLLYEFNGSCDTLSLAWFPQREDCLLCGTADGYVVSMSFSLGIISARGIRVHTVPVECIAITGCFVASGGSRELRVWSWQAEGQCQPWMLRADIAEPPPSNPDDPQDVLVTSLHWTKSDGVRKLVVTYLNHGIRIFTAGSWTCPEEINVDGQIVRADLSQDGTLLVISNLLTGFDLYSLETGELLRAFGHDVGGKYPTPVKFIEAESAIVGGSAVGEMHIWDTATGRRVQTISYGG